MVNKIRYWGVRILGVLIGAFFMVFGEFDDSPGLQGIGLILIVTIVAFAVRDYRRGS